ncbi:MAG: flagellar hook assembly protein FlgD [Candidatus Deferrimicrobiaceae bacterium]
MTIAVTNDWKSYVAPATDTKKSANGAMGKDDFLKLLFTQLKYQDPQNPVDDREFAAQLAQFSSLEQMTNLNTSFGEIKTALQQQGKFSLLQAVGKTARADGNGLVADATGTMNGIFSLDAAATSVKVTVTDAGGTPLRTINLGAKKAGENIFTWDGTLEGGMKVPAGQYRFFVEAADSAGQVVSSATSMEGIVTGVTLDDDPAAIIGNFSIPFTKIRQLKS